MEHGFGDSLDVFDTARRIYLSCLHIRRRDQVNHNSNLGRSCQSRNDYMTLISFNAKLIYLLYLVDSNLLIALGVVTSCFSRSYGYWLLSTRGRIQTNKPGLQLGFEQNQVVQVVSFFGPIRRMQTSQLWLDYIRSIQK